MFVQHFQEMISFNF